MLASTYDSDEQSSYYKIYVVILYLENQKRPSYKIFQCQRHRAKKNDTRDIANPETDTVVKV